MDLLSRLIELDTTVFLSINGVNTPFLDQFMMLFTGRYAWVLMYASMLFAVMRNFKWRTALCWVVAVVLVITLCDQLCASIIRPMVGRLRPSHPDNPISELVYLVNNYRAGNYGFPSCHAANSFGLAMILTLLFRKARFGVFVMAWAIVNSMSRLYLGVHYPGDLLVGAIIGLAIGAIVYDVTQRLIRAVSGSNGRLPDPTIHLSAKGGRTLKFNPSDVVIVAGVGTILFLAVKAACMAY